MAVTEESFPGKGAYLILGKPEVAGSVQIARRYDFEKSVVLVSNQPGADIALVSASDKDYSVILFYHPTRGWMFENRGASASVLLNGFPSEERRVHDGDLLQIGENVFHFLEGVGLMSGIYQQLFEMINEDLLTKAFTKRHFFYILDEWINLSMRSGTPLSLLMIDFDSFKQYNDTYGHLGGDAVLQQTCQRITKRLRKGDVFCRYAGDEFTVILPNTNRENAFKVAEELRLEVEKGPVFYADKEIPVTFSIGVAQFAEGMDKNAFIDLADNNAYQAKNTGRNRVVG